MKVQTDVKAGFLSLCLDVDIDVDIDFGCGGCGHSKYRRCGGC